MITYTLSNSILNRGFGGSVWNPPVTLYVGLSSTAINADGTGATEPSGSFAGAYARVAIDNTNKNAFSAAANGIVSNSVQVSFAESTSSWFNSSGGPATYVFLADALTGGNILCYDVLNPTRAIVIGTTLLFIVGAMQISLVN